MTEITRSIETNDGSIVVNQIQKSHHQNQDCSNNQEGRNPFLKRFNGGRSNSGGSSSSTGTVTGGGCGGGGGARGLGGTGTRDVNFCEVYHLSPSKRNKGTNKEHQLHQQQFQQQQCPVVSSIQHEPVISWTATQKKRDKIKQHGILDNSTTAAAITSYGIGSCGGSSGVGSGGVGFQLNRPPLPSCSVGVDQNLDNFEIRSHYSDSATMTPMQLGRTTTISAMGGGTTTTRPGNVTFSNCSNVGVTAAANCTEERIHSNRGSLRRSKGRSNQSLCSCDADTEIVPDPNRPLYQYSLDRKNKTHTYTCEQNAQILMRLEREKRKATGIVIIAPGDKQGTTTEAVNSSFNQSSDDATFDYPTTPYQETSISQESDSTTDVDIIPPPPPPITMNRKTLSAATTAAGMYHQHQQQQQQQHQHQHQDNLTKGYTSNSVKPSESMLNDCTSTILNCANVGHVNTTEPDLCHVNKTAAAKSSRIESLLSSSSSTANKISRANLENIPLTPYPYIRDDSYVPCFKSKGGGEESVFFYHQESPQYAPNFDNRPMHNSGKFNTIGPSSCYAKQFAHLQNSSHCNLNQFDSSNLMNGRYFSQSLSNFSFTADQHTAAPGTGGGSGVAATSIQDVNGGGNYHWHYHNLDSNTPYTQFRTQANGLSCSFGESTLINSSYTSIGSSTSGLKGKIHHQHQQQQQQSSNSNMPWKHRQCPSRGSSSSGTNSLRFDPSRHWLAVSSILLIVGAASVAVPLALRVAASAPFEERLRVATQLLDEVPLIDGHNDLPWNIRKFLHNKLNDFNFDEDLRNVMPWARSHWSHTDLQRLKKGRVSAQFWAAYVPCEAQHRDAVQLTLEQIDVIKRLTERYSPQLTSCTSVSDIIEAHKNHQLCSLTGVEGGHSLGGSLAVLRTLYAIGVRYMTLTSTCHTPWADSSYADAPTYNVKHGGLTVFGKTIIREMNRLGMIVDLSHVSTGTMRDALATTEAPVIFSHSSAYELCNSSRNVQDDVLESVAKNGGLVMVNFYSKFLSCSENSTVQDAVAHINHIKNVAGIDHVGLGAGFDGINFTPKDLEDVSTYPKLFAELLGDGWSIEDLTKLAGQNFLRVLSEVEKIREVKKLSGVRPYEDHPNFRTEDPYNCTSS